MNRARAQRADARWRRYERRYRSLRITAGSSLTKCVWFARARRHVTRGRR